MAMIRRVVILTLVGMVVVSTTGCTFFACSGGGPLRYDELGDWAGIPERKLTSEQIAELRGGDDWGFVDWGAMWRTGRWRFPADLWTLWLPMPGHTWRVPFTLARGYELRYVFPRYKWWYPSARDGAMLFVAPAKRRDSGVREFHASQHQWGLGILIGDLLLAGSTANAYESSTGTRVAAEHGNFFLGYGVGYTRVRTVMPVDEEGGSGLHVLRDRSVGLSDVRYALKDGTVLLLGAVAWGRVNRKRYIQILWIPIPVGKVEL
jgi:hypothetical protein